MLKWTAVAVALLAALYAAKTPVEGAKILAVFPTSARSHYIVGSALMKELARRGHEVSAHYLVTFGLGN